MGQVSVTRTTVEHGSIDTDALRQVAREVDVFGGIGHISMFTEEAQQRRLAAVALLQAADVIDALAT